MRDPKRDIFIDIDNIPKGVDFVEHLDRQVAQCDVMLAVIGPAWLSVKDPNTDRRRLDDPADFVRIEVASALKRGIPVVPVVLDETKIPSAESLPDDLKALARRNGERLEHESFDADVGRLIRGLPTATPKQKVGAAASPKRNSQPSSAQPSRWIGIAVSIAALAVAGGGAWAWFGNPGDWRGIEAAPSDPAPPATDESAGDNAASSDAKPGAGSTQTAGACGDVIAIVYFDFDNAVLRTDASAVLEGAVRKTFDCVVERVSIEAHEDLGGTAAYAQKLSERRADAVAAALQSSGIEPGKITKTGLGDTRPLSAGIASPLNRRVEVTLSLSSPQVTVPKPVVSAPSSTPASITQDNSTPRAGETFRDCADCPQMVSIPAGSFMMGSPASEARRDSNEGSQRRVSIRQFAVGKFEVTFDQWSACVNRGGCSGYNPADQGWGRGNRPVINVSWEDARDYVSWLSGETGRSYRLLTEAEWEYAARAGTTTPFGFAAPISTAQANYNGSYTYGTAREEGQYRQHTTPVDTFQPNAFGLHDMHGNVWEWVQDCTAVNYSSVHPSDGSAFTSNICPYRVSRGGSWNDGPQYLRSAYRGGSAPTDRDDSSGFRVARTF